MRILLVMDPLIPVPPVHYGGIERVVADLADGLVTRGHAVTLWAGPGSGTSARLMTFGNQGEWSRFSNVRNVLHIGARFLRNRNRFDVVHNFGRLAYLLPILRWSLPKVQTYMRPIDPSNMRWCRRLGSRRLHFTAVSGAIRDTGIAGGGDWSVIYNCARVEAFGPQGHVDPSSSPLVFLGRLERCKGAHTAIDVAERSGRALIIAGNVSTLPHEKAYFEREIAPRIDGQRIRYIGPVDDRQKRNLLAEAAALLLPIEWMEPFPVVIPEALLSGTPILAFPRGGVPEGVSHGRTGFLCEGLDEMVSRVSQLGTLDRRLCREESVRRFGQDAVVAEYERLYRRLASSTSA